ncbi:MAG: GGDEF domain-containing protein [Candidatus Pacebacteria bacterium]|nr:GGDEF domain-containing protein [Candidatus Paceibacterota bacterium]
MFKKISEFFKIIGIVLKYGEKGLLKDPLTGLYNRLILNEIMNRELWESERHNTPFSIILIDLDNLKIINDKKGHLEGDKALIEVSSTIKKNLRKTDIAGRWGGDEFLIALPYTSKRGAELLLQRIKKHILLGISAGISESKKGITIQEMIDIADKEMYSEKKAKKSFN